MSAHKPASILWENVEVTSRSRFYRQCATSFETQLPADGLCGQSLLAIYDVRHDVRGFQDEREESKRVICSDEAYSNRVHYAMNSALRSVGSACPSSVLCLGLCVPEQHASSCPSWSTPSACTRWRADCVAIAMALQVATGINPLLHCFCVAIPHKTEGKLLVTNAQ